MALRNKILIVIIFILTIAVSAWFLLGGVKCTALTIKKENAVKGITVTGTVESTEDVEVTTQVTAVIKSLYVSSGDVVQKGQVLAELEKEETAGNLQASESRLQAVQSQQQKIQVDYKDAQLDEKRYKSLYDMGAVSKRELEQRTLRRLGLEEQLSENKRQIEASAGDVSAVRGRLENYTVRAPISGVITQKFSATGDIVSPQNPLFRLVSPENIILSMAVEENELNSLQIGQSALVIFDAYPDKVYNEKVIYLSKQVNPLTGTFEARINKPKDKNIKILVGMTVDATIVIKEFKNVIIIPSDYVLEEDNKTYVFVKNNTFANKKEIETTTYDNNRVLVTKGLEEGDVILSRLGNGKLKDNSKIKVVELND